MRNGPASYSAFGPGPAFGIATHVFLRSRFGRLIGAVADNEIRVEYLGFSVHRIVWVAYGIAGILAGAPGNCTGRFVGPSVSIRNLPLLDDRWRLHLCCAPQRSGERSQSRVRGFLARNAAQLRLGMVSGPVAIGVWRDDAGDRSVSTNGEVSIIWSCCSGLALRKRVTPGRFLWCRDRHHERPAAMHVREFTSTQVR